MDELLKQVIATSPMAALLAYMVFRVYQDSREDRVNASLERAAMLERLEELTKAVVALADLVAPRQVRSGDAEKKERG